MAKQDKELLAFNRGVISKIGLARIDLERMAMSAEQMTNWMPRVLGSMMIRPGLEHIDNTNLNQFARNLPFTFGVDETALIELANVNMKVRIDDQVITRASVATSIGNDDFNVGLAPWVDTSDTNGVVTAISDSYVKLKGNGTDFGRVEQTITVAGGDQGVEHALRVDVLEGPVVLKLGTSSQDDDLIEELTLFRGLYSLAFTPEVGTIYVTLQNQRKFNAWVDECSIEPAGEMEFLTPWSTNDLPFLRWDQSGDVIYIACKNGDTTGLDVNASRLMKIERRGTGRSWALVDYFPLDGPFRTENITGLTLTPGALNGDTTLTASEPLFRQEHATFRSLWRLESQGQVATESISGGDLWAPDGDAAEPGIRVVGSGDARVIGIILETIAAGTCTFTLQFSFGEDGPWNDTGQSWTQAQLPVSTTYNDGQDGQIIYYRLGVKTGDWTSGTFQVTLTYTGGAIQGIARTRTFTSSTQINVQVLEDFGSTDATKIWWEGEWSARRGYPTSVALHEGRLWWGGLDKIWGSESDAYETFDDQLEGDAGAISRQIGSGPQRVIHWMVAMGRLMFGTSENSANVAAVRMDGNHVLGARSNSFDEPLTPTNFNIKTISSRGVFVDRTKQRLYELLYDIDQQDYRSLDLSVYAPDFNEIGIKQIAVQMKPDIRVHCVREDGTVGMLVYDRLENVVCWCDLDSSGAAGEVEDVAVLPGVIEDQVYWIVKRTINGGTERHICKWALESEARGGTVNKMADSFVHYSGAATTTPFTTELLHLAGETVVIWADGCDCGTDTVTLAGALTNPLATAASEVVVGLGYQARFKSAKIAEIQGIGLLERKKIARIGFLGAWLHYQGLKYGPDFTNMRQLPLVEDGQQTAVDTIHTDYHEDDFAFGGDWDTDSRICLEANAPRPATILAAIAEIESVEKTGRRN